MILQRYPLWHTKKEVADVKKYYERLRKILKNNAELYKKINEILKEKNFEGKNMKIDTLEQKINDLTPQQKEYLNKELSKPDRSLLYRIGAYALGIAAALTITTTALPPKADAAGLATIDGKPQMITTTGAFGRTSDGQRVYTNRITDQNGNVIMQKSPINYDAPASTQTQTNPTYKQKTRTPYEILKHDVETLVRNKSQPQTIREKVASAEKILNTKEKSNIYNSLGNQMQEQKNLSEALFYYKKASNLGPEYKKDFSGIVQYLETKVR